jgi:hypothetical protein
VTDWRERARRALPEPGPVRLIVTVSLISSVGFGLYLSGSAVYFVRSVGLDPVQVGAGLSAAGLAGLPFGILVGRLADRFGSRDVTLALCAAQAGLLVAATQVRSFGAFLVVIVLLGGTESGTDVGRQAIISAVLEGADRVRVSAYSRSVFNAGFTLGVLAAGIAIGVDTRPGYLLLLLGNAATAAAVSLLYLRLPRLPGSRSERAGWSALRDLPYVLVAQTSGLTRLGGTVLTIGLPIWVVTHTEAPRPVAAWLIGVNTVLVVLLQVRASRGASTVAGATRLQCWSFVALALTCLAAGLSGLVPRWPAVALLVLAALLVTLGELWGESARWLLRYEMAAPSAQGEYGGVFQLGTAVPAVAGPALVTALPDRLALAGWLGIAAVFLVGWVLTRPAVRWAERTRDAYFARPVSP